MPLTVEQTVNPTSSFATCLSESHYLHLCYAGVVSSLSTLIGGCNCKQDSGESELWVRGLLTGASYGTMSHSRLENYQSDCLWLAAHAGLNFPALVSASPAQADCSAGKHNRVRL